MLYALPTTPKRSRRGGTPRGGSWARRSPRDQKKKAEIEAKCARQHSCASLRCGLLGTTPRAAHDIGRPATFNDRVRRALRETRRRMRWREHFLCAEKLSVVQSHRGESQRRVERARCAPTHRRRKKAVTHERVPRNAPNSRESRTCRTFRAIQFRSVARLRMRRSSASASVSDTPSARRISKSVRSSRRPARRISLRTSVGARSSARPMASYEWPSMKCRR